MKNVLVAFILLPFSCLAQSTFFVQGTVGKYSMKDMKELQKELQTEMNENGINMKAVADFPMSLQVDLGFLKETMENTLAGAYINYAYTKGRLHYSDYSGETYIDQNVSRIVLGGMFVKIIPHGFGFYGKMGMDYSMLNFDFYSKIGSTSESEQVKFHSLGVNVEPGFSWAYDILNFAIKINAGYEFNFQGKTRLDENEDAFLQDSNGDKVLINWTGMRAGVALTYRLE